MEIKPKMLRLKSWRYVIIFSFFIVNVFSQNGDNIKYDIGKTFEVIENNSSVDLSFLYNGNILLDFYRSESFDNTLSIKCNEKNIKIKVYSINKLNELGVLYDKELFNKINKSENKTNKELKYKIVLGSDFRTINDVQIVE